MQSIENGNELDTLLENWEDSPKQIKQTFLQLKDHLANKEQVTLHFNSRPGVSHSLRVRHLKQRKRSLFAMVDVIDDDPQNRWLSVCFYGEMISDPDDIGDLVPEGLLGEDALCFDIETKENDLPAYVEKRLDEAYAFAALNGE